MKWLYIFRTKEWLGMAIAAFVLLFLATWLLRDLDGELHNRQQHRFAMVEANALGITLSRITDGDYQSALQKWKDSEANRVEARLIVGGEWAASTKANDNVPRRLTIDEKPIYDSANSLRAAYETNQKGDQSKKHLVRFNSDNTRVLVQFPLIVQKQFAGMVEMTLDINTALHLPILRNYFLPIFLWVMAVCFALFNVALMRDGGKRRAWLSVVGFVLIGVFYSYNIFDTFKQQVFLSDLMTAKAVEKHMALNVQDNLTAASVLDTDRYLQPRGIILANGQLSVEAQNKLFDETTGLFKVNLAAVNVLSLGILLFFYSGMANAAVSALRQHYSAYAYIAPAMFGMFVLVLFPFLYGITLAFTDTTLFNESDSFADRFIGVQNFFSILGDVHLYSKNDDGVIWNYQSFYWTLMMTIFWTISNVTIGVTLGLILALALNTEGLRGRAIYRILLILPWAIPNYISALVWRGTFHPQYGVINQALQLVGLEPVPWFEGVFTSFMTGVVANGWLSFPFMMVVILGGLQSIPKDMYEAAYLEGATAWQRLKRITLPLLRPTIVPAIVLSVVWTFNMFNIIFLVSGGEPAGANEILITKAYKIAFENYRYGYAAAYSVVIFMILLIYGIFQTKITRATESY